jgi:hypothetical protein
MINEASGLDFGIARKAIVEAAFVLLPGRRLDLDVVVTPGQIGHDRVLPQRLQNDPRLSVLRQDGLAHRPSGDCKSSSDRTRQGSRCCPNGGLGKEWPPQVTDTLIGLKRLPHACIEGYRLPVAR